MWVLFDVAFDKNNPSISESTDLANQWAVVTGSSTGIGHAIAMELAQDGCNVIVHGFQKLNLLNTLPRRFANLTESHVILGDLSLAATRDKFCQQAWGIAPVDIWINNAGTDVLTSEAADWTFEEKLEQLWNVDIQATIHLSRIIGKQMRQRGSGTILNIGWDQADSGMAGDSGEMFAASKGAIMAFTRSSAKSLAPQVRVNCLAPGWVQTTWGDTASDYWQQRAIGESLLNRWVN